MARRKSFLQPRRQGSGPSTPSLVKMDSLIQGISQQPAHLRLVGQGQEQINGWSSPVEGLTKRNPMRLIARIKDQPLDDFYLEMMDVTADESYSVLLYEDGSKLKMDLFRNGIPPALDVHGTGMTVAGSTVTIDSTGYLSNSGDLFKKYVLINNGPIAFLLNREKVTQMDSALSPTRGNEGLAFIQGVAYEVTYDLKLDGTSVGAVTTPKATDSNNKLSTSDVASQIAAKVNAVSGFNATAQGYVVKIAKNDGSAFTAELDDGRSGSLARAFTDKVTRLSELPTLAPNGYVINIQGDPSTEVDDRWLKFTTNGGGNFGDGSWGETVKPGIQYKLDADTMPLVIYRAAQDKLFIGPADGAVRTANGETFTFPTWAGRTAGDEKTVPDPEFVGQKIRDHVLFRSRYAVCAGVSVVFSETDDVFNFFQDTSVALTETDPFGLRSSSERSSGLEWLLAVDESLLAFSKYSQFQVRAADADVLTPSTAIILRLSNIQGNVHVRPKLAGPQVLFPTDEFGYSHFREYTFFDSTQRRIGLNLGGSNDITLNLPKYIDGLVTHWDVGETLDTMVCRTPANKKTLYVYKYLWQSGGSGLAKAQASWSKWVFSQDVQWVKYMDNALWMVLTDANGTYSCTITGDELENIEEVQPHLDRLLLYPDCNRDFQTTNDVGATYDAATNTTTFTLPYTPTTTAHAVTRFKGPRKEGLWLGSSNNNTIVCSTPGDWTSEAIAFGEEYLFSYEFSQAYLPSRDQAKSKVIGNLSGRTQVLRWHIYHHNTGYYEVRVKRRGRSDTLQKFRARFLNTLNNKLDTETGFLDTGRINVPVYGKNDEVRVLVESRSWLPLVLSGAAWEGSYSDRSRGLN